MKRIIYYLIIVAIIALTFVYRDKLITYVTNNIIKQEVREELKFNDYAKKESYSYVKTTDNFDVKNEEDIKNVFYTILDSGISNFSFYCDNDYIDCNNDVTKFFDDREKLSDINNFVHPYNSFKNIRVSITNYGKVTVYINHVYDNEKIITIETKINEFINQNISADMNVNDKIKLFHDYIVNNTKFDIDIENSEDKLKSDSYTAYGLFVNNLAICGGYSDAMSIYLDKLKIKNYRISTLEHVWNLVYTDNNWLHLDVTWDDPVTSDKSDMLMYDYYLIDSNTLLSKDTTQHNFNKDIYKEAN